MKSITASGACDGSPFSDGDGGGQWQVFITGNGKCHVVVSFKSGGQYTDDVPVSRCTGGACCAACGPYADRDVQVPSLDDAGR